MATWLITGANRGIGLGLAGRLAARGDTVVAAARDPAAPALAALAAAHPGRVVPLRLDVTDAASVAAAAAALGDRPLDVLVNNAGVIGPDRQGALDMDFDGFLETLAVNTLGPLRVAQAVLPNLRRGTGPRIVTVSSSMGALSGSATGRLAYRASKAAVNKTMQGLAGELRGDGVTVVVVHPGWVKTDMGGGGADLTVERSTAGLVAVIDRLTPADSGRFLDWEGRALSW